MVVEGFGAHIGGLGDRFGGVWEPQNVPRRPYFQGNLAGPKFYRIFFTVYMMGDGFGTSF